MRKVFAIIALVPLGACMPQPEASSSGQVSIRQAVMDETRTHAIARGFVFRCEGRRIVEREADLEKAFNTRMARFEAQGFARADVITEVQRIAEPDVNSEFQRSVRAYLTARGVPLDGPSAQACRAGMAEIDTATPVGRLLRRT